MYTPINTKIKKDTIYRVIIDTQNSADGSRGFQLPAMNTYTFDIYTTLELKHSDIFVPQKDPFKYFECVSLITNVNSKNMMVVRFNPLAKNIPVSAGNFAGGYLKLYFPTLSEESEYLYQDDLGTGKKDGDTIQCYARNGFPASTVLECKLYLGNRVYGQHAYILIQGWTGLLAPDPSFTTGFQELFSKVISPPFTGTDKFYEFDIDQFYTPAVIGDDKHIEMRLESYDATNTLLEQSFSYDMTLKQYTPTTGTQPKPTKSSDTLFDQSVTFDLKMQSAIQLKNSEEYDFFIFEYTQPFFDPQPQNIQCESGSVYVCRVSQGNNWIVVKPLNTLQAQANLKFKNSNNPIEVPTTGIVCKAYAVKDRIISTIYTYAAIDDYILPNLLATAYNTIVTPMDYADNTIVTTISYNYTIPKNTQIRVRVEIIIPVQSITLPYGSIIDIFLPTGFLAYDYSLSTSDSNAKFLTADNLQTSVVASSTVTGFTGRPQLTITGWEPIKVGEKIIQQNLN